jgi:hypothetical protein
MPIVWTNANDMYNQSKECLNFFENIQEFFDIENKIYSEYWESKGETFEVDNMLCFGDGQIDNIAFDYATKQATVRFVKYLPCKREYRGKICNNIFYVFDFENVEEFRCDIAPEYYINDFYIQKNESGRFFILIEGLDLSFSFGKGKANRWWME